MEIGERFDPLAGVTAQDAEDGEITLTEKNIIDNDIDIAKAGTYHVTYRVTDQNGASTQKTITVTIKEKAVDQPELPQTPESPQTPEVPQTPEAPQTPESPQTPEAPQTPGAPQKPAEPQTPNQPAHTAETPKQPLPPKTGDLTQIEETLFILLGTVGIFVTLVWKKRKRNEH
ncbi:putative uncharacterized protein [Lachnospiraceae bacterium CAG:215]|nr:putative uncharacterized protein [Lachnospiraceae bacterium CAG:215]